MITLHNPQNTIVFSLDLASEIGDKEAMLLPKLAEWLKTGIVYGATDKKSGKLYTQLLTYNDDGEIWRKIELETIFNGGFQFMSIATISRKIQSLEKQGLIKSRNDLTRKGDSSKFYAIDRDGINSLKSLFFTEEDTPTPKNPDKVYSHSANGGSHNANYNIEEDSFKDLESYTQDSSKKNIKDCKDKKEANSTLPDQVNETNIPEFPSQQQYAKSLLTPDPDDPRPTSLDERQRCRTKLAKIMNIDEDLNATLLNRMMDKLYPRYREYELMNMETYWRSGFEYKSGTIYPSKYHVFFYIKRAKTWADTGYNDNETQRQQEAEEFLDYITNLEYEQDRDAIRTKEAIFNQIPRLNGLPTPNELIEHRNKWLIEHGYPQYVQELEPTP